jgi:type II secretory pathway pseudopilin PulG
MVLLTLVLSALTTVIVSAINAEAGMNQRYQAQSNARTALTTLRRDVHCASTLTVNGGGSVTITLPASCSFGNGQVTWCTQGAAQRWGLYRVTGATCAGGTQYADYLTTSSVFTFSGSVAGTSLAKLHVDFPINLSPGSRSSYELIDDIVLHNSTR